MKLFTRRKKEPDNNGEVKEKVEVVAELYVEQLIGQSAMATHHLVNNIIAKLADKFVEDHYAEITANMDAKQMADKFMEEAVRIITARVFSGIGGKRDRVKVKVEGCSRSTYGDTPPSGYSL